MIDQSEQFLNKVNLLSNLLEGVIDLLETEDDPSPASHEAKGDDIFF